MKPRLPRLIVIAICAGLAAISGCGPLEIWSDAPLQSDGGTGPSAKGTGGSRASTGGSAGQSAAGTPSSAGAVAGDGTSDGGAAGATQNGGMSELGGAGASSVPETLSCAPDLTNWEGCVSGQPCSVCSEEIKDYPLYLLNRPNCRSFYACDHSPRHSACSSDCSPPNSADQCDGTLGNWSGCRGRGCYVCSELVADYPRYFKNHRFCISNSTCDGAYFTCSAACPAPTDEDR